MSQEIENTAVISSGNSHNQEAKVSFRRGKWDKEEHHKFIEGLFIYGNQWKKYIAYDINDTFPLGHGEKSVLIAQQFIRLTGEEILAIRWHMGFTDPGTFLSFYEKPAFMKAINDVPLVMVIAQADCFASFLMETEYNLKTNEIV